MNKIRFIKYIFLSCLFTTSVVSAEIKYDINIYQVMQRVIDRYPSLKIAEIEIAQAIEQRQQVESSLGWILNSAAGLTHDVTAIGIPADRVDFSSAIKRQLKSGATLSLTGSYRYEDSTLSLSPILPNPSHTTRLDLSYRLPLAQGNGNPLYIEGIVSADENYIIAKASQLLTRITLAERVKDLFYSSVMTRAKISNATQAVQRAKNLKEYINKNVRIGLSDKKDKLQARAQLHSKLADLSAIQLQWQQQQNALNRLMLENWENKINPILVLTNNDDETDVFKLIKKTENYHPAIKISKAKYKIAQSKINSTRDIKKDNFDLVVSIGSRTSDGSSTNGTVSEQDWAGSIKIEYQHLFDDNGVSSKHKQALLEKHIAQQNIQKAQDDIGYTISGLVAEIKAAKHAVATANQKLISESLKLKEAENLFRNGRADTAQIIQFQNEYAFAQLSYQNQKVSLNSRIIALQIFTGQFWNEIEMKNGERR